jgi:hypothetical protein
LSSRCVGAGAALLTALTVVASVGGPFAIACAIDDPASTAVVAIVLVLTSGQRLDLAVRAAVAIRSGQLIEGTRERSRLSSPWIDLQVGSVDQAGDPRDDDRHRLRER